MRGMSEIQKLLPHRNPFLFVDEITQADEETVVGLRTFGSEPFFEGHFPDYPVVPGVVLIETMAQVGGAGVRKTGVIGDDKLFFLAAVEKAKFRRQVRPGDTVRIEVSNLRASARMLKQAGIAYVGDEIAAEAQWMCIVADESALPG